MKTLLKNLLALSLLLGAFIQVNASDSFTFQDAVLTAKDGKTAKVFLGVPLSVKKEMEKKSEVTIDGFLFGKELYSTEQKELLIATLDDGFKVSKKTGNKVVLTGTIDNELITDNGPEVWEEHEEFFYEMCSQCHAAPSVPHHSMVEWEAIFSTMKGFSKLDEEEASYLLRYLKSNASNGLLKTEH